MFRLVWKCSRYEPIDQTMPRYFIALPLPDDVKDRLIAVQPPAVPGMRILARDELHLTLHFLGEVSTHDIDTATAALAAVRMNAFTIRLSGVGMFASERHAKVLWAGVEPNADLTALHRSIGKVLAAAIGFQPEDRPYSPHITLARIDAPSIPEVIDGYLEENRGFVVPSVRIDRFVLYSSDFADNVPKYQEVAVFLLLQSTMSWGNDLQTRFPNWLSNAAHPNWPAVKASLSVGQQVSGVVIARTPFGVWLDIGVAFPALLLVPDMRDARKRRIAFEDYPQKGDSVQGCIKALGDPGKIWIAQMNRLYCPKCGGMLETATDGLRL